VAATLNEIVAKSHQMDELVAEVANASHEQTQGITQINTAVGQMDKVTQSNAASAEESAAAAQELNAQAETMKQSVAELLQLVGGGHQMAATMAPALPFKEIPATKPTRKSSSPVRGNGHSPVAPELASAASSRRNDIPLEGDFKGF